MKLNALVESVGGQLKFAESLGVTQTAVSYWLNGKCEPTKENRVRILEVYAGRISIEELLGN